MKGGRNIKSRAEYFRQRRKNKRSFNVLIDKENIDKLEEKLKKTNKTKKQWLEEKIDEELNKDVEIKKEI